MNGVTGFRTAGVDLASQDRFTAVAVIRWTEGLAVLESATLGVGTDEILATAADVRLIGIDCPLGWPRRFTDLLIASRLSGAAGWSVPADVGADDESRRGLAYRLTDHDVHERTGRWPLSVSADRIAYPAMRCAGLLAGLAAQGQPVARSGIDSVVAEVYPAAALRSWRCATAGYKTDPDARSALVRELTARAGWLDLGQFAALCNASADVLDAVVCALVAGAVVCGRTGRPPSEHLEPADEEGWIHLPHADFLEAPFRS